MLLFIIAMVFVICRISSADERRLNEQKTRRISAPRQTADLSGRVFEAEDIGPSGGFTVK